MYVFGRERVRVGECVEAFRELFPDRESRVLVLYDTVYAHCKGKSLARVLKADCNNTCVYLTTHPS